MQTLGHSLLLRLLFERTSPDSQLPSPTSFSCVVLRLDAVLNAGMNGAQEVRCLSNKLVGLTHRTGLRGKELVR